MTKESDVTIILPNYNSELYIKKTLTLFLIRPTKIGG